MKALLRKTSILFLAILMIFAGSVSPSLQADTVSDVSTVLMMSGKAEEGKTVSISVKVSGDGPYGGFNGSVNVDSAFFEITDIKAGNYASSNFSKGTNTFLDYNCNIVSDSTLVVIDLKCLKEGSSVISVSLEVSSLDGLISYDTGASANIDIKAPVVLSNNCNLSALSVSPGSLSPAFSKDTLNYSMTVNDSVSSVAVTATAEDAAAKVSLNGVQNDLQIGENTIKITVTAENGDTKVYKISCTRGTPTPTPAPYPILTSGGVNYTFLDKESLSNPPSGFTWSETTYGGVNVPCLVGPDGTLLMWLLSDEGNGLYVYDLPSQTVTPCYAYETTSSSYMFIAFPKDYTAPSGYELINYAGEGFSTQAYRNIEDPNLPLLVYMLDAEGHEGLFYLDEVTGLVMPYRGDIKALIVEPTAVPTEAPEPTETPTPAPTATVVPQVTQETKVNGVSHYYKAATFALGALSIVLFALVITLLVVRRFEKNQMLAEMMAAEENYREENEEEPEKDEEESQEEHSEVAEAPETRKDFYYQFGDDPDVPQQSARASFEEEPQKNDMIPDFPDFPQDKNDGNNQN